MLEIVLKIAVLVGLITQRL